MAERQPEWRISFPGDGDGDPQPPSRFVQVEVSLRLEVVDEDALREAARAAYRRDFGHEPDEEQLAVPANCAGYATRAADLLVGLPGVELRSSGSSAGSWTPEEIVPGVRERGDTR